MRRIIIIFCSFDYFCIDNFRCCVWSGLDVSIWYLTFFCILIFDDIALNSETLFCTNNFLSVCCGWLAGFTDNWFGCTLTTAKVTRLRKIQGYTGLCQKNLKSKVTRFQKLRGYAELWLEILKGYKVTEVTGCAGLYHPPPLKLRGCGGYRGLCQINSKDIHQVST